ncbi:hypothetical protein GOODEAATRI_011401, partial [Goodea atripinnis]
MSGAGGGKRPSGGDSPPGPPEKKSKKEEKTTTTLIEPIRIAGVSSTEEMDMKVLQFKNKKLCERLEQRQAMEDELREKIEKLEKRQATDDTTLLIVNRYWSQLEESVNVLRKCIEPETPPASAPAPPSAPPSETPLMEDSGVGLTSPTSAVPPPPLPEAQSEGGQTDQLEESQEDHQEEQQPPPPVGADELMTPTEPPSVSKADVSPPPPLSANAKGFLATLEQSGEEELSLHLQDRMLFSKEAIAHLVRVFDRLHARIDDMCKAIQATGNHRETKVSEMETTVEDLQWDIEKLRNREQKLNKHLAEAMEQIVLITSELKRDTSGHATMEFESLNAELEHNQELANSRMAELEKLQLELQEAVRETEKLKSDELSLQKKLRTEVIQLEDTLAQVRKEYEMLRIEFEQNLAANEQAGPINREMRHLISSLQNHNLQLKGDVQRYKRKLRETQLEINKVEDLRMRVRELEERERKESKKLADEDALRKIRVAEETIEHLQKKLAATKQ